MRKTLAVAILILGIAAATEAQDYTTYRTWSEVVAGIDAKYAKLTRISDPGTPASPGYTGFWFFGLEQFDVSGRYALGMKSTTSRPARGGRCPGRSTLSRRTAVTRSRTILSG